MKSPLRMYRGLIETVPSGLKVLELQGCPAHRVGDNGAEHEDD
jgi:hypothetical protein